MYDSGSCFCRGPKSLDEKVVEIIVGLICWAGIIGGIYYLTRNKENSAGRKELIKREIAKGYVSGSDSHCYQINTEGKAELVVRKGDNFYTYPLPDEDKGRK